MKLLGPQIPTPPSPSDLLATSTPLRVAAAVGKLGRSAGGVSREGGAEMPFGMCVILAAALASGSDCIRDGTLGKCMEVSINEGETEVSSENKKN